MTNYLVKNVSVVDSGKIFSTDLLVKSGRFFSILPEIGNLSINHKEINGEGLFLIPGVIDVHVHFREPGLTYKATIYSESRAAAAGGVTSFIEMPNTIPPTTTIRALEEKFQLASDSSLINYSFYLGAANDNFDELLKAKSKGAAGIKIFLGSSTGNLLVDDEATLNKIFSDIDHLLVVHAEDEGIIQKNLLKYREKFGDQIPFELHEKIRPAEACFASTVRAIGLAEKYGSRLHLAHISTGSETKLFKTDKITATKKITCETGVQYLFFDSGDYEKYGSKIKCNPSIKNPNHKRALLKALLDDRIDLIASDHAPHTLEEKNNPYTKAPSGIPLIQHSLPVMLELFHEGKIRLEEIVQKMCHAPAISHRLKERGFVREGYKADFVLLDLKKEMTVKEDNIYYKCKWSPFINKTFHSVIQQTFVNGEMIYELGNFFSLKSAEKIDFFK